jgi:hypothetical protein
VQLKRDEGVIVSRMVSVRMQLRRLDAVMRLFGSAWEGKTCLGNGVLKDPPKSFQKMNKKFELEPILSAVHLKKLPPYLHICTLDEFYHTTQAPRRRGRYYKTTPQGDNHSSTDKFVLGRRN